MFVFLLELVVRMCIERKRFVYDAANWFDTILVVAGLADMFVGLPVSDTEDKQSIVMLRSSPAIQWALLLSPKLFEQRGFFLLCFCGCTSVAGSAAVRCVSFAVRYGASFEVSACRPPGSHLQARQCFHATGN